MLSSRQRWQTGLVSDVAWCDLASFLRQQNALSTDLLPRSLSLSLFFYSDVKIAKVPILGVTSTLAWIRAAAVRLPLLRAAVTFIPRAC